MNDIAVGNSTTIRITLNEIDNDLKDNLVQIICDSCPEEHLEHSEGLVALLYLCLATFKESDLDLMPMDIVVSSDIPMGAGLGSSAAFSVALAAALVHLQNGLKRRSDDEEADKYVICKWAFKSEKIIHGNPSGTVFFILRFFFKSSLGKIYPQSISYFRF